MVNACENSQTFRFDFGFKPIDRLFCSKVTGNGFQSVERHCVLRLSKLPKSAMRLAVPIDCNRKGGSQSDSKPRQHAAASIFCLVSEAKILRHVAGHH